MKLKNAIVNSIKTIFNQGEYKKIQIRVPYMSKSLLLCALCIEAVGKENCDITIINTRKFSTLSSPDYKEMIACKISDAEIFKSEDPSRQINIIRDYREKCDPIFTRIPERYRLYFITYIKDVIYEGIHAVHDIDEWDCDTLYVLNMNFQEFLLLKELDEESFVTMCDTYFLPFYGLTHDMIDIISQSMGFDSLGYVYDPTTFIDTNFQYRDDELIRKIKVYFSSYKNLKKIDMKKELIENLPTVSDEESYLISSYYLGYLRGCQSIYYEENRFNKEMDI